VAANVAITDVAVAMGPRNRRRLTGGAISLAVIAALVFGGSLFNRSAGNPGSSATHAGRSAANTKNIIFGMSPTQVEQVVGRPKKVQSTAQGPCWLYRPRDSMVGALALSEVGSEAYGSEDGFKVCFFGSAVTQMFVHGPKRFPARPGSVYVWRAFSGNPYYTVVVKVPKSAGH